MRTLALVLSLVLFFAPASFADSTTISSESAQYAGWSVNYDFSNNTGNQLVTGPTIVYDNIAAPSAVSAATSSTDLNQTWGDRVTLSDTGYFDGVGVSIFNSGTGNTLPILTTTIVFRFYDATTFNPANLASNTPLFGFNGNVNFGTGLNTGFFTTVQFTGLGTAFGSAATSWMLTKPNLVVTQQLQNITGGSLRAGVVTFTVDNIGTQYLANNDWYRNTPSTGASGLVAFAAPTSNRIALTVRAVPEPGSLGAIGLGLLALAMFRRRK